MYCTALSFSVIVNNCTTIRVSKAHTGVTMAGVVHQILEQHRIVSKVCLLLFRHLKCPILIAQVIGLTADNASSNDTMTDHLVQLMPEWGGQRNRIRCINHVINLVEKVM